MSADVITFCWIFVISLDMLWACQSINSVFTTQSCFFRSLRGIAKAGKHTGTKVGQHFVWWKQKTNQQVVNLWQKSVTLSPILGECLMENLCDCQSENFLDLGKISNFPMLGRISSQNWNSPKVRTFVSQVFWLLEPPLPFYCVPSRPKWKKLL